MEERAGCIKGLEKEGKCEHVDREGEMWGSHFWNNARMMGL